MPTSLTNGGLIATSGPGDLELHTTGEITNTGGTVNMTTGSGPGLTGGTVEAVNTRTLTFTGTAQNATFSSGAGSVLNLTDATVNAGAVNVTGTLNLTGSTLTSTLTNNGIVNSFGGNQIGGTLQNNSGATINVADGTSLALATGGSYTNNGTINLGPGSRRRAGRRRSEKR